MVFELRQLDTGKLVHIYTTEGAALAFVRDVIRIGGRDAAAQFVLNRRDEPEGQRTVAAGRSLVHKALEDRAE